MDMNSLTKGLLRYKKWFVTHFSETRIKSGTPKYPTVQDVFETSINVLTELGELHIAHFRIRRSSWWAMIEWDKMSVEFSGGNYLIHIKFPRGNSPKRAFEENKIKIPEGWEVRKLGKRWAVLYVTRTHKEQIAPFLKSIYEKLYTGSEEYYLIGQINFRDGGGY